MKVFCPNCIKEEELSPEKWHCDCGSAWEPLLQKQFNKNNIDSHRKDIWRYLKLFELESLTPSIIFGAGWTPLLLTDFNGLPIFVKLEYISPTGSFKDRGTELEINIIKQQGIKTVVDDSSGNAGASLAAYAARGKIEANIFVPEYSSKSKQNQISVYGANVYCVPGERENAKQKAQETINDEVIYASHAYHPGFLLGQETIAWEIWEQLEGNIPDWLIMPVGQGVQLIGAWLGFSRLKTAGLINKLPRLVAVQPSLLNPIINSLDNFENELVDITPKEPSIAEGLAIKKPVRWKRIIQAIKDSNGIGISVSEINIINAISELGKKGFFVEPSSAIAYAALPSLLKYLKKTDTVVISLTGNGLKGIPEFI